MKDLSIYDSMKYFRDDVLTKDILLGSFFGGIKEDPKFLKAYEETFEETI